MKLKQRTPERAIDCDDECENFMFWLLLLLLLWVKYFVLSLNQHNNTTRYTLPNCTTKFAFDTVGLVDDSIHFLRSSNHFCCWHPEPHKWKKLEIKNKNQKWMCFALLSIVNCDSILYSRVFIRLSVILLRIHETKKNNRVNVCDAMWIANKWRMGNGRVWVCSLFSNAICWMFSVVIYLCEREPTVIELWVANSAELLELSIRDKRLMQLNWNVSGIEFSVFCLFQNSNTNLLVTKAYGVPFIENNQIYSSICCLWHSANFSSRNFFRFSIGILRNPYHLLCSSSPPNPCNAKRWLMSFV